jgi:chloramphenicol 3-O phosphotransferase
VIIVLNGAPRSGKSSTAAAIQETFDGLWMNIGVDVARQMTPPRAQPGIGLRPGEPDHAAAPHVGLLYAALWETVAAHERLGLNVVVDCGIYQPDIAADARRRLQGLPVLWVGVRCPLDVLEARGGKARWHDVVHTQLAYDLEVDTSALTPGECAAKIATVSA